MGRNVNKQSQIAGQTFSTNTFFCNMLTCMNNYIWHFLIITGMFRCLNMVEVQDVNNSDLKDTGIASLNTK